MPAWWGRSPLGVSFERAKETKTRLGRSPLRTPLGYQAVHASSLSSARDPCCGSWYCHHTRPPWAAGPTAWRFSCPGLPWKSGVPAAGGFCRTSCVAVVGAVACPARGCPGLALGDSGGASTQQPKKCGNVPGHFRPKAPLTQGSLWPWLCFATITHNILCIKYNIAIYIDFPSGQCYHRRAPPTGRPAQIHREERGLCTK